MENRKTIAFQGRRGAYSESAAYHLFGCDIEVLPVDSFDELHQSVVDGTAHGAVVPIENSTAGSIHENYDLLLKHRLPIVGEVKLQIEHCLMALPGTTVASLDEIISHPQALAQCSNFFQSHPKIQRTAFFDTAGSAQEIAHQKQQRRGAIASRFAAQHYGLEVLIEPLANQPGSNFTRFFAVQKQTVDVDALLHTKTSLAFVPHQNTAGILHQCLGCFATRHINLIRIESRPKTGTPWEYVFYLDFAGNPLQSPVQDALRELAQLNVDIHMLGSYPVGLNQHLKY